MDSQHSEPHISSTGTKLVRKVHFSCRVFVLLVFAVIGLVLVGYVTMTVLKLSNDGLNGELNEFQKENKMLQATSKEFEADNQQLKQSIGFLAITNQKLQENVAQFKVQNAQFAETLTQLNGTYDLLNQRLMELQETQERLQDEVHNLKNESNVLSGEVDELNRLEIQLNNQLLNFSSLRKEIEQYSKDKAESLEQVESVTLVLFNNITEMDELNKRIDLFQVAVGAEFLQHMSPGFTQMEFTRFLQNAGTLLNISYDTLSTEYSFSSLVNSTSNIVAWDVVVNIINDLVSGEMNIAQQMYYTALQEVGLGGTEWASM